MRWCSATSRSEARRRRVPAPTLFGVDVGTSGSHSGDYPRPFGLVAIATLPSSRYWPSSDAARPARCLAVRTNERAASAIGINVASTKLFAFGLSAFIAGSAGGLIGYQQGRLSPESFSIFVSLMLLSIAYIGGIATVPGVIFAGFVLAPGGLGYTAMERWFHLGTSRSSPRRDRQRHPQSRRRRRAQSCGGLASQGGAAIETAPSERASRCGTHECAARGPRSARVRRRDRRRQQNVPSTRALVGSSVRTARARRPVPGAYRLPAAIDGRLRRPRPRRHGAAQAGPARPVRTFQSVEPSSI